MEEVLGCRGVSKVTVGSAPERWYGNGGVLCLARGRPKGWSKGHRSRGPRGSVGLLKSLWRKNQTLFDEDARAVRSNRPSPVGPEWLIAVRVSSQARWIESRRMVPFGKAARAGKQQHRGRKAPPRPGNVHFSCRSFGGGSVCLQPNAARAGSDRSERPARKDPKEVSGDARPDGETD